MSLILCAEAVVKCCIYTIYRFTETADIYCGFMNLLFLFVPHYTRGWPHGWIPIYSVLGIYTGIWGVPTLLLFFFRISFFYRLWNSIWQTAQRACFFMIRKAKSDRLDIRERNASSFILYSIVEIVKFPQTAAYNSKKPSALIKSIQLNT